MQTTIIISGGLHGISILESFLKRGACDRKDIGFGKRKLIYKTRKEAKKTMKSAYRCLVHDEPEKLNKNGGIRMDDDFLMYDTAIAKIEKTY